MKTLRKLLFLLGALLAVATVDPSAHAGAIIVPSISNTAGLPVALNSKRDLVASSNVAALNPFHLQQLGAGYNTGTVATNLYSRVKIFVPYGVTNPRLVYSNWYLLTSGEALGTGPISPYCAIEDSAGNLYPCTFNGNRTGGTIDNGSPGNLVTDPVAMYVAPVSAGGPGYIWARTYLQLERYAYTDLVIDGTTNTKVTSAARPFTTADVGSLLRVTGGTGFTAASYTISSVTGVTATLNAAVGTLSSTGGTASLAPDVALNGVTTSANGDYVVANSTTSDPTAITTGSAVNNYAYWPLAVIGKLPINTPSVFVDGDSISVPTPGYIFTPLANVIPLFHAGASGNSMAMLQKKTGYGRYSMLQYATHLYHEMGINEYRGVTSLTAQQFIDFASYDLNLYNTLNIKVVLQTLTPFSTNATTALNVWSDAQASQTPQSNDAARRCFNDWMRSLTYPGITIAALNSKYGITLSANTKLPAQIAPGATCVDVAALLETDSSNVGITISPTTGQSTGGYYRVPSAPAVTGAAAGAATTTTSIKGTFTANQYNSYIIKFTSGVASGMYSVVTATSVSAMTVSPALGATPGTGDTYNLYAAYSDDGTHPCTGVSNPNGDATLRSANTVNTGLFTFSFQTSARDLSNMLASTIFHTRPRKYRLTY